MEKGIANDNPGWARVAIYRFHVLVSPLTIARFKCRTGEATSIEARKTKMLDSGNSRESLGLPVRFRSLHASYSTW